MRLGGSYSCWPARASTEWGGFWMWCQRASHCVLLLRSSNDCVERVNSVQRLFDCRSMACHGPARSLLDLSIASVRSKCLLKHHHRFIVKTIQISA
jgi:hypothetical protein